MQNPQSPLVRAMDNQVTKTWEAYGNKDVIFYQHLEPFDKAQEKLSELIAQRTTHRVNTLQVQTTTEFLTYFIKSVLKCRIKMEKYKINKDDKEFTIYLDYVIKEITTGDYNKISLLDYTWVLFKIGRVYERLGYSSPERERTRTTMQSDMELPGMDTPEFMENPPSQVKYTEAEDDEL